MWVDMVLLNLVTEVSGMPGELGLGYNLTWHNKLANLVLPESVCITAGLVLGL